MKLDNRFGWPLDNQACTPTFTTFQGILTTFKPNPSENARRSFTFEHFLIIEIYHRFECPFDRQACRWNFKTFQNISPLLIPTLAKPYNRVSLLTNFSELKFDHRFIQCTPTFTMSNVILVVIQGWSSKGLRDAIFFTFL